MELSLPGAKVLESESSCYPTGCLVAVRPVFNLRLCHYIFKALFLSFFTVRDMVGISVSVSFSVCKPGLEWKVGCRERIPTTPVPVTDTRRSLNLDIGRYQL